MYSEELSGLFVKLGIKVGDTISIVSGKGSSEGILMPRTDAGDSGIIVIKKKDGYNIGLRYAKEMRISKIKSGEGHFVFPKIEAGVDKTLSNITMLYTGGTIGSKVDYLSGGVHVLVNAAELLAEVPEMQKVANINVKDIMHTFSENVSHEDWSAMAGEVASAIKDGAEGVIVTHGTDTMHYTSAALSFMLDGLNSPVVLTGAQRSSDRGSSDAFINLLCSANLAAHSDIAEVMICMHDRSSDDKCSAIRGTKARKMQTSRRDAFRSVNSEPIARVDSSGKIEYVSDYRKREGRGKVPKVLSKFEPKVALVKVYPNSDPEIIDHYVKKGYKGIILEGTGLGHAPMDTKRPEYSWKNRIGAAASSDVIVGMTSQCIFGRVDYKVYSTGRDLQSLGVVYCEDMMPEVAYVKLGFLLGNYGAKKAKEMLNKNIAGEITKRSTYVDNFV